MKCFECGSEDVRTSREDYEYTESGLANVVLENIEVHRCGACGDVTASIPRIEALHRAIAITLTRKTERLTGAEVRFLRTWLELPGAELARVMGVSASTVSRWEHDKEPIGPLADRLLRLAVVTRPPTQDFPLAALERIGDEVAASRLRARLSKNEWHAHA